MRMSFMVLFFFITAATSASTSTSAPADDAWTVTDAATILKAVGADSSRIKIVNMWATWCPPCKAEIPEFIKFSTQHPKIPVYFVSGDDSTDTKTPTEFLRRLTTGHGTHLRLYQLDHIDDKQLKAFAPAWAGGLPGTFLYDVHGKLLKFWVGATTAKILAERIKALDPGALKR